MPALTSGQFQNRHHDSVMEASCLMLWMSFFSWSDLARTQTWGKQLVKMTTRDSKTRARMDQGLQ